MPFPPKLDEEEEDLENEEEEDEDEDESTSDAPPEKMKGNKPNPLRRWAEESEF